MTRIKTFESKSNELLDESVNKWLELMENDKNILFSIQQIVKTSERFPNDDALKTKYDLTVLYYSCPVEKQGNLEDNPDVKVDNSLTTQ